MKESNLDQANNHCDHCGEPCMDNDIHQDDLHFCCMGCQTVYTVLKSQEELGGSIRYPRLEKYEFLDNDEIQDALLSFRTEQQARVAFSLPQIHCSSCIQILEKLPDLHRGVMLSRIDFPNKRLHLAYYPEIISLRELAELVDYLGYAPSINLDATSKKALDVDKDLILKLGTAGFIFGNVMLMSFPEYLGLDNPLFERIFGYLSLAFSIPLLTFSASDYIKSAYSALLNKTLNIDVPISIGIIALFGRSALDIITHSGPGYLDSLSGFIFFLLIGRWFQKKTYDRIAFDRDYESYFPLYTSKITNDQIEPVMLKNIQVGDQLVIKSQEIIPSDGQLDSHTGNIDYSFVTGEDRPVKVSRSTKLFAGGRNLGAAITMTVTNEVNQSYLTKLWEENETGGTNKERSVLTDRIGTYFTIAILMVAVVTLAYWLKVDPTMAMHAFTSVLIIACPCVIALSIPFTYGTFLSLLSKQSIFIKSTQTLEQLQLADTIVFDKTGTITIGSSSEVKYCGIPLTFNEKEALANLLSQSSHPLSRSVYEMLNLNESQLEITDFAEHAGKGIEGNVGLIHLQAGSAEWLGIEIENDIIGPTVHLSINGSYKGYFAIEASYRPHLKQVIEALRQNYELYILSGDNEAQKQVLVDQFGFSVNQLRFNQSPTDKKTFIKSLQSEGKKVLMIGDGLNDAGALLQSHAGIVLTEDLNNFTPASDVILEASMFRRLPDIFNLINSERTILYFLYTMAVIYNLIGLYFAVQGWLSPVVAAILMPTSSVSMVVLGHLLTRILVKRSTSVWYEISNSEHQEEMSKLSVI